MHTQKLYTFKGLNYKTIHVNSVNVSYQSSFLGMA